MRRFLASVLAAALTAGAVPAGAYAQAAVRVLAPRTAPAPVVAPGALVAPRTAGLGTLGASPSFIGTVSPALLRLPSPLPSLSAAPAADLPSGAVAARSEAALRPTPAVVSALAPAAPDSPQASAAPNDDGPPARSLPAAGRETKGRIALRFAELRAAFGARTAQELAPELPAEATRPAAALDKPSLSPARPTNEPAAEPPAPKSRGLFGIAPALLVFLGALAIESVGIEAQNLGLPPLITKVFGDVTLSAEMGMWAAFADVVGSVLTPLLTKRLGLKKTFLWSGGARLVFAALTAGLLATAHLSVPGLMALTALGALVGGINYTTEKAIPAVILEQDRAGLERFKAARQGVIEVIATLVPIAAGALVAQFGFLPAVFAFPVAGAVAMALVAATLRLPQRAAAALNADVPAGSPPGGFWRSLTRGTRLLWGRAALRTSFLAYAAFSVLSHLLYWIIAPAYGILVAGPGHEEAAALVQGVMLGLFSLGGLVASLYMMREHKRFDRLDPAERDPAMRRSLKRWMVIGTVVLAAMVTLAVPMPAWGALTVPALALIPFGMAQVVAKLKLEALFQASAPPEALDDATAALEAWMSIAIMAGLWGVKLAFAASTGYGPFAIIAWAMLPLAAVSLLLTHLLARSKKTV